MLAVGALGVGGGLALRNREEPVKDPEITWEQTPQAIKVHIHNPNRTWGMRNQRVRIRLKTADGYPFQWYGPDDLNGVKDHPKLRKIPCCLIPELRPGGDFTFTLHPSFSYTLGGLDLVLKGGDGWVKM